jgi:hypothetical protein
MRVITLIVLTWGAHQAAFRGKLDRQANGPLHLAAQHERRLLGGLAQEVHARLRRAAAGVLDRQTALLVQADLGARHATAGASFGRARGQLEAIGAFDALVGLVGDMPVIMTRSSRTILHSPFLRCTAPFHNQGKHKGQAAVGWRAEDAGGPAPSATAARSDAAGEKAAVQRRIDVAAVG